MARWFLGQVAQRADLRVDVMDLAEAWPPVASPGMPAAELAAAIVAVGDRLEAADAFVVVTSELDDSEQRDVARADNVNYTRLARYGHLDAFF